MEAKSQVCYNLLSPNIMSLISLEGYVLVLDEERVKEQASCGVHTFSIHSSLVGTQCFSSPSCSILSKARAQEFLYLSPLSSQLTLVPPLGHWVQFYRNLGVFLV